MSVFGDDYAALYDLTYTDKDYARETELVLERVAVHLSRPPGTVIDLGCGTGGHAVEFARLGMHVTGVDRSPGMLAAARERAAASDTVVDLVLGDIGDLQLGDRQFDLAIMMFAVLGYLDDNASAIAALRSVARHLVPDGLLAFDVWFGPAVLTQRPAERCRVVDTPGQQLIRSSRGTLDVLSQRCDVDIRTWLVHGSEVMREAHEVHRMRYFFPRELELLADAAGFELVHLGTFDGSGAAPSEDSWSVLGVMRLR